MKIYRARMVVPMRKSIVENGAVVVKDGRIIYVGIYTEVQKLFGGAEREDLGECVLLPGLINAHCHLDYTLFRGAIQPQQSFTKWIQRINALRQTVTDEDFLASIARGFEESRRYGTTTLFNVESYPELMWAMPRPPLRTWWFFEMMDVRNRLDTEEVITGALSFFENREDALGGFGLSPHAPYTASLDLYRSATRVARDLQMPFMTHLAESDEEFAMFTNGEGALFDFLKGLGRSTEDLKGRTPLAHLLEGNALPDRAMLVHMNQLVESDFQWLATNQKSRDFQIVHCPGTHRYFDRAPFPLERLCEEGYDISLGTDSLASNRSLSLFEEMRILREVHPRVSPEEALRMVTLHPAKAIGMEGQLGELSEGACADMIAIPYEGAATDVYEAIVGHQSSVDWLMLNGELE